MSYKKNFRRGDSKINLLKPCFSLFALLFFLSFNIQAKNYYFSSSSGSDSYSSTQAQSQATPWKSITKLNSFFGSIVAGDNIYFKRGDTFYGCIVLTKSGTSGNLITIGAYGSGNKPIISGLITLSSWSAAGNGVYQAYAPAVKNTVNLVTLNGIPQQVGRYPNTNTTNGGYLTYESYSGTTSITDDQLTGATNWTGAEVVIRKQHYAMERCKITNHSNSVISYIPTASINPLNSPKPFIAGGSSGFGYFIQRDPRTLDQLGEWYFNTSDKYMEMYFGGNNPSSYTISVSTLDTLINIGTRNYININNISLEGANLTAIYAANAGNITIQSCDMNTMGGKGILFFNCPNILVDGVNTNNILCGAIDVTSRYQGNTTIRNCNTNNTGIIAGMGSFWDDNDYKGISVTVSSGALIEYNNIVNNGYVGIQFQGNNVMIKNNFVNYYDFVKDDGGGIYTVASGSDASPGTQYTNRTIQENIVMNGIGASKGTRGDIDVDGIFLDGVSMNVDILNNTVANVGMNGIYSNNSHNINIRGNTSFNNGSAVGISRYAWSSTKNLSIKQNIFYPKYSNQYNFQYVNTGVNVPLVSTIQAAMQAMGDIDSNYHATPNATGFTYFYSLTESTGFIFPPPMSFTGWKTFTYHDLASKLPSKIAANVDTDLRFEYNESKSAKTVTLDANYMGVDGTTYNGTITLQPYTSKILVRNGPITGTPQTVTATATVPFINCFGGSTTVTVTASGGRAPYTGTGNFSATAGKGCLKLSVPVPTAGNSTFLYSAIGAVSNAKSYVLRFSTLGTTNNGSLTAYLRKTGSPYSTITSVRSATFGTTRIDHEFIFNSPATEAAASFLIDIDQTSGTTYIDNIAFFEATSAGIPTSDNLFSNPNFETGIDDITAWSNNQNHVIELDLTSKISNIYYYPVTDANGDIAVAAALTNQPDEALMATSAAGNITYTGGTTTVIVAATGGTAPYTGTGSFPNVGVGTYHYIVTDAMGCTVTTTITITQSGSSGNMIAVATAPDILCFGGNTTVTVTGSGGIPPYSGTGSYTVNAGRGSLKISVPNPVSQRANTLIYSTIGEVSSDKSYVLRFSTLGTSANGSLNASLRQTVNPWAQITPTQNRSFGTTRVDHQFIFTAPQPEDAASFLIELLQSSGTTYIDNIAFFEATSTGELLSKNLYANGQFETNINGITTWSLSNNHLAEWDGTSKINNTYYYFVQDATGESYTAGVTARQPAQPLQINLSAPEITVPGGTTTVTVTATGGTAPYSGGIGNHIVDAGNYSYTVTDANGCTSTGSITVTETSARTQSGAKVFGFTDPLSKVGDKNIENTALKVSSYPIPAITEFGLQVEGGTAETVKIKVQSIDGRVLYQTKGNTNTKYVFGNNFPPGIYLVKVMQGNNSQVLKIVKGKF